MDQAQATCSGASASLSMVLVGKAVDYLPYILLALQELGKRGLGRDQVTFEVQELLAGDGSVLFCKSEGTQIQIPDPTLLPLEDGPARSSRFSIRFETPARIQSRGKIIRDPSLFDVVSSLSRRLFLLHHFHDNGSPAPVNSPFLDAAKSATIVGSKLEWRDHRRYSTRQKRSVPMGGVTGVVTYDGDLGVLEPILRAGEYVHVGKSATFGLGKFRLTVGDTP